MSVFLSLLNDRAVSYRLAVGAINDELHQPPIFRYAKQKKRDSPENESLPKSIFINIPFRFTRSVPFFTSLRPV
jgi:hypothetical protein